MTWGLLGEIEGDRATVQHAEHDDLAMQAGRGGDAEDHVLPADGHADAAILRQAALGDVHFREDFDA